MRDRDEMGRGKGGILFPVDTLVRVGNVQKEILLVVLLKIGETSVELKENAEKLAFKRRYNFTWILD